MSIVISLESMNPMGLCPNQVKKHQDNSERKGQMSLVLASVFGSEKLFMLVHPPYPWIDHTGSRMDL